GGSPRRLQAPCRGRSAPGSRARGTSRGSRRRLWMTRRLASSSDPARPLARASTLAGAATTGPRLAPVPLRQRPPSPPTGGLQELQRLDVDQVLVLADDVRLPHRLEELLRPVEFPQADLDAAQALRDVAVGPGARHDRVLTREAHGLLVEGGERNPR